MGVFLLDTLVKIGYCTFMFGDIVSFVLRILLIVALWAFVWRLLEPRTQLMRILRAAVLLLGLLGVLVVLRIAGRWLRSFNPTSFYFGVLYSVLVPMVSVGVRCRRFAHGEFDICSRHCEKPFGYAQDKLRDEAISTISSGFSLWKTGWGKTLA